MGSFFRTLSFLLVVTAGLSVLTAADYYLRREPSRKAVRELERLGIEMTVDNAVKAAAGDDVTELEALIAAGVPASTPGPTGETPLLAAVKAGAADTIDLLLQQDAETLGLERRDGGAEGPTVFQLALAKRDFALADRLLDKGANPAAFEIRAGKPALLEALERGDEALLTYTLAKGADLDAADAAGLKPLVLAVRQEKGDAIHTLLEAGASVDATTPEGHPLLAELLEDGRYDAAAQLLENGAGPDITLTGGETALGAAVRTGDAVLLDLLLHHGADPARAVGAGQPAPLDLAIRGGNLPAARRLIDAGAKVTTGAALFAGYASGDEKLLDMALEAGGDLKSRDSKDRTLLDVAIADQNYGAVEILLKRGADPRGQVWKALDAADIELAALLIEHGAPVDETKVLGEGETAQAVTPLEWAVTYKRPDFAKLLLDHGENPRRQDQYGNPLFYKALLAGDRPIVDEFLRHGFAVQNGRYHDGRTVLEWALAYQMNDVIKALVEGGADVAEASLTTASTAFADQFKSKTFRYYLESDTGITPLLLAVAKQDYESVKLLMAAGAKAGHYTKKHKIWPINVASWYSDVKMMQLLLGREPDDLDQPGRLIVVDLDKQKAIYYEDGVEKISTKISTGKKGYGTPAGTYVVTNKHRHWTSTIYDAKMPYFLRLSCGAFGLHEGYVPNYPASHGCIRVPAGNAKKLFETARLGDVVIIR